VLDPIDGTYNFKRDMRESAISIGYIENGESIAGVIYDPYKDELFEAEEGKGALRNGEAIHVSEQTTLAGASIATSNSYDDEAMARNLRRHLGIYEKGGVMPWTNCPGSGVLIMAYVACGRFDAYHHNGLKPWDNAAAFVIVREAGGVVRNLRSEEVKFTTADVLMGTPAVVDKLQVIFDQLEPALLS
jgi:myo-inositol-1(or 4)-monophosphatase